MRLFALNGTGELGAVVAAKMGRTLDPHEEREFEEGEHKARPLVSVRGREVFVIHSLAGSGAGTVNDRLCRLLFFLACCRDNGAARVTAIVPYFAYSRKDRQTKPRDPVTTRYVAQLLETMGSDRVVTLDVHNLAAFQNSFRCQTVHLTARHLFVAEMKRLAGREPVVVLSPDGGGVKRAQLLKESYESRTGREAGFGFMEKRRSSGKVTGDLFAGEVDGKVVFIVDDMIASGGTMLRAAGTCRERGASVVHALATHGLFGPGSDELFVARGIDRIAITDSVSTAAAMAADSGRRLNIVSVAPLIAETIVRLHQGEAISDLTGIED
ncbi:MAG: ribose-phosphate diphosphokinase [Paracoccus sp.]|nr:ribose-phosphate diphosphokinase [Paracoccus sp. (in: a-proteobacteria)]